MLRIDRQVGEDDVAVGRAADGEFLLRQVALADDRIAAAGALGNQLEMEFLGHRLTST